MQANQFTFLTKPGATKADFRPYLALMVVILLMAAGLRFYGLGDAGFDGDEIWVVQDMGYARADLVMEKHFYDPLLFATTRASMSVWGNSPLALRLPEAAEGTLAVAVAFVVARKLFGRKAGLIAAALLAISLFHITISRTGRYYPLFTLLALGAIYYSWEFSLGRKRALFGLMLCCIAGYYNHAAYLLVMLSSALFLFGITIADGLLRKMSPRETAIRCGLLIAGFTVTMVCLLPSQTFGNVITGLVRFVAPRLAGPVNSLSVLTGAKGTVGAASQPLVATVLGLLRYYAQGRGVGFALMSACALIGLGASLAGHRRQAFLLLALFATPVAALYAKMFGRIIWPPYFIGMFVSYLLFAAFGIYTAAVAIHRWLMQDHARARQSVSYVFSASMILALGVASGAGARSDPPTPQATDWKGAGQYLNAHVKANDLVIITPNLDHSTEHLLYYWNTSSLSAQPVFMKNADFDYMLDVLTQTAPRRVWWVLWTSYDNVADWEQLGFTVARFKHLTIVHRQDDVPSSSALASDCRTLLDTLLRTMPFDAEPGHLHSVRAIARRNLARCTSISGDQAAALAELNASADEYIQAIRIVGRPGTYTFRQLLLLDDVYRQVGGGEASVDWQMRLEREFPGAPWLRYLRGERYLAAGNNAAAIDEFRQLVDDQPADVPYRMELAEAYHRQGHDDLAEAQMRTATRLEEREDWWAYPSLAELYVSEGRSQDAENLYREAIGRARYMEQPHVGLGDMLLKEKRYDEAAAEYQAALSIYGRGDPVVLMSISAKLSRCWAASGDIERGLAYVQQQLSLYPDYSYLWDTLGQIYVSAGELDRAEEAYARALDLNPGREATHALLAQLYDKMGQHDRAVKLYQQVAQRFEGAPWPHLWLGNEYRNTGHPELATIEYRRVLEFHPDERYGKLGLAASGWSLSATLPQVAVEANGKPLIWRNGGWQTNDAKPATLVSASNLKADGRVRPGAVFFHPPDNEHTSNITLRVPAHGYASLATSFGLADDAASKSNGVRYRIQVSQDGGKTFRTVIDQSVAAGPWSTSRLDLSPFSGTDFLLRLQVDAAGDFAYDWLLVTLDLQPVVG